MTTGDAAARQAEVVLTLLDALAAQHRAAAVRGVEDGRTAWSYLPGRRDGVALNDLPREHQQDVLRLVATVLRQHAVAQVAAIMALEDVLDLAEGGTGRRHRGDYWLTVFGRPGDPAWGWRFEGHHVSVNITVAAGQVRAVPLFLGANPATVNHDDAVVLRPLGREEDLARELLSRLDRTARERAVVAEEAPDDIRTGRQSFVDGLPDEGLAGGDLAPDGREALRRLTDVYLHRLQPDLLAETVRRLDDGGWDELRFQWRGSTTVGEPHYYAVAGAGLLLEYDNTQNDANHVHSVLRLPRQDFGADLLAAHWARHH